MFTKVENDVVEPLALGLGAWACVRHLAPQVGETVDELPNLAFAKQLLASVYPASQSGRIVGVQETPDLPELLHDVVPVEAAFSAWKELVLLAPDMFRAVCQKERSLASVAALVGLLAQPTHQRKPLTGSVVAVRE